MAVKYSQLQKVDLNEYNNIEYGYSSTLDSAQGKTCHNTYYHFNAWDKINLNKIYVTATRTINDQGTHFYIDDFDKFKESALQDDGKKSAWETLLNMKNKKHLTDILDCFPDSKESYKSPMDRAKEYREKSGEIFINDSLERTISDIPKQLSTMETQKDRAKDESEDIHKEYDNNFKKVGIFSNKIYVNKADVERIIGDIKKGSMTIPRDWKDIQAELKYSEYMQKAMSKTYREIYRPRKLGGRTRKIPYARMSEPERKKREEKVWNKFKTEFRFNEKYAKEIYSMVSRELERINEREIPKKKEKIKEKEKEFVMER